MLKKYWPRVLLIVSMFVIVFGVPSLHVRAQGSAGFTKIASPTATTYLDTTCPKAGTCQYQITATATGDPESGPSNTISVLNSGAVGNVSLTWSAGTCPTGKNCATPTGYNVYQLAPSVPPVALAGASQ